MKALECWQNLITVIPILMHFLTFTHSNQLFATKTLAVWTTYIHYIDQAQAKLLMTSVNRQYITEYTVANLQCCPIRHRFIFSSALE